MLEDICSIVETDFCMYMEGRLIDKEPKYTIEESMEMANRLARIYGIAHGIHCHVCDRKYCEKLEKTSIVKLNLPMRIENSLWNGGVRYIEQLVKFTPKKLMGFRGFGKKALAVVGEILEKRGLSIAI